ncbi:hypothetical protein [Gilliamella apis]|uniref:hypothetical protein n=1 Tax=Gilliamella apis TaxID=1970738 RepID=UPI000A33DC86|nr:hypothetical protein [Gilliamella apis]OTQ34291.1 hypothetical protein B6C84_10290 [Gilliamella apis]OTQ34407.1 hypothetical protein B6C88_11380 [Gilliamella apis]OTQ38824.1 hypothetical protein B6D26_11200 [Gilliamella apis]OTQ39302.1 hypothetical protein B6C94_11465 [Gilliamella apis]OTQ47461.1 hypothetical protein B6C86_02215 [Gilliamella apis]
MVLVLTVVILQSISFSNYALTTKTTNIIYGSAPYLTFDGGRTRVTNTEALLGISLSDGRKFTPTTNNSSYNPIVLPVAGQSFNDIGMLVPRNTDSIALSSLIGTPYNYWGDDDGDGQGIDGVTATGSLNLLIEDKDGYRVARNEVLNICKAPYKLMLSNDGGTLKTRYGVPNESRFTAGYATYYINPKASPVICFARPNRIEPGFNGIWVRGNGFLPQSFTPSSYGLNFPTTGANNLYFDLLIAGTNQALSWAPVSHGGITATMTDSPDYWGWVRVTLTGPAVTDPNQWQSENPGRIARPSLPQTFELVGRDSRGNAVVKYGFVLKQWFVNRGDRNRYTYSSTESWCNKIGGYRLPKVKDLTNASCRESSSFICGYRDTNIKAVLNALTATPSSSYNNVVRYIGAGFFTEWGNMLSYIGANFVGQLAYTNGEYLTSDRSIFNNPIYNNQFFAISGNDGSVYSTSYIAGKTYGLCVYP